MLILRALFVKIAILWSFLLAGQPAIVKLGISVEFGNEVKRIGLCFDANTNYYFVQGNFFTGLYYNFSSWGIQKKTPEIKVGAAAHFGFGKQNNKINQFVSLHDNNLDYNFSVGYAYQYYFDWQGTSQSTGLIVGNYKNVSVLTENDLFGAGKGWRDRFRTGALKINYRYQKYRFGINVLLYTGDYASCSKIMHDSEYPARFGYRSQDKAVFGDKSVGILSMQGEYVGPYYQSARIDLGINSERVRHGIQNKGLHDMPFYTDKMVKRQLMHIPMLQGDGSIYTFKEGQVIRPNKFYYNLSLNPTAFY